MIRLFGAYNDENKLVLPRNQPLSVLFVMFINLFRICSLAFPLAKGVSKKFLGLLIVLGALLGVITPPNTFSQESSTSSRQYVLSEIDLQTIRNQLLQIINRKLAIKAELEALKAGTQNKEATDRIEELRNARKELNKDFEVIASRINKEDLFKDTEAEMNWLDELKELTMPLLQAVHEISEKPRRIDKLKARITLLKLQIAKYQEAGISINLLLNSQNSKHPVDQQVLQAYRKQLNKLESKYNPEILKLKLSEAERSLSQVQTKQISVLGVISRALSNFFQERGKNLLIASMTFLGLWWGLLRVYGALNQRPFIFNRLNPQLRRLVKTVANISIVIVCALASLISLYLLDDWLLLSIAILIIMALAWTSRQLIPGLLKELRIIMNLGTVREGERMIWKGVPFYVKEIGLYTTLINDQLEGGMIRMPVGELIDHHSRPVVDSESWFPTQKGDWIFLDDGTYGRVERQTMEQVTLYNYASLKYYPTSDFLSQKPRNLSQGYRLVITFGLDYGTQSRVCNELPKMFEEGLKNYLTYYYNKEPSVITSLHVNFESAGASSLNLIILVKVDGLYGEDYYPLKWDVNKYLVQICNDNDLVIPFTQMTVSLSDDVKKLVSQQEVSNPKLPNEKQS